MRIGTVQMQHKKLNAFEHRRHIIKSVVYDGISVDDVAEELGVGRDTVFRALKRWGVSFPVHLCGFPRSANWFRYKSRLSLPDKLKKLNRSEIEELYRTMTQTELADRLMVSRRAVDRMLDYHCIPKRTAKENYEFSRTQDRLAGAAG